MSTRVVLHPSKQSLNCWNLPETEKEVYVHPLSKRSTCSMSLEMCTESLGSETGSVEEECSFGIIKEEAKTRQRQRVRKKHSNMSSFPPPLTSSVQVQTHREGGRLVIKAFNCTSYFRAERHNGRLRLSLLKDGGCDQQELNCRGGFNDGGKLSSRCNGHRRTENQSFPFWVAISSII